MKNDNIVGYFTRDYKLYIIYYILFYIFYFLGSKPEIGVELWKFYFPFKSIVFAIAIEMANIHDMIREQYYLGYTEYWDFLKNIDYWRSWIVGILAFLFNIVFLGLLTVLIKYYTGIDMLFIIV